MQSPSVCLIFCKNHRSLWLLGEFILLRSHYQAICHTSGYHLRWKANPRKIPLLLSQNHRMSGIGRDLERSSSPIPLPEPYHLLISMETTKVTKSTITLFDRAHSRLQNSLFWTQSPPLAIQFSPEMKSCATKNVNDHPEHGLPSTLLLPVLKYTIHCMC